MTGILGKKRAPAAATRTMTARCCGRRLRTAKLLRCGSVDGGDAAAVLRPGGLVRPDHGRTLLAVADRRDPIGRDAESDEHVLHGSRAALAEREVVLARA